MSLPHSDVLECLRVVTILSPHLVQGDGGSEAARERALNSAVASGRLRGRASCFPRVVEGQPGGMSLTSVGAWILCQRFGDRQAGSKSV